MSATRYWVWLSALAGLSSRAAAQVLAHFGGPMEAYFAPSAAYDALPELTRKDRELLRDKDMAETERILAACEAQGIRVLTRQDADYPSRLAQIYDPPAVLYLRGRLPFMDESPVIAIVGTRRCSVYGEKMALRIGYQVASGGGIVVSGLALGIDGAAAKGALMAGSRCVGVLGTAIDVAYPASHASLIRDVAAAGCVLSEYPPGSRTANFPRRNRILSGLATGVCVVEAPAKSGALITANDALEQGRDLFAVPGNADNPACAGSNALLRECARMVTDGADILEEYRGRYAVDVEAVRPRRPYPLPKSAAAGDAPSPAPPLDKTPSIAYIDLETRIEGCSESQKQLARLLAAGERQVDELIAATGFSAAKTLAELTLLCIRGVASPLPGKRYTIKRLEE